MLSCVNGKIVRGKQRRFSVAEARKTSSNYVYVIDSRMDALTPEKDQKGLILHCAKIINS